METPVARAAGRMGLRVLAPPRVRDIAEAIRDGEPDIGVIVAYGQIIPKEIIESFRLGILNLHFSVLPRWRGAAPVQRAILAGDHSTGVCTMLIDEGLDTGPIIECVSTEIGPDERAGELEERLANLGGPLVVRSCEALVTSRAEPRPQPSEGVTYAPPLRRDECLIEWESAAVHIERLVRAAHPHPCSYTYFRGKILKIHRAKPSERWCLPAAGESRSSFPGEIVPGSIIDAGGRFVVECGEGLLEVVEVQPEGRRVMTAAEFLRGARIARGERLGGI